MTVHLFDPSKTVKKAKLLKPARVLPLDHSTFPPAVRSRFLAFARSQQDARQWADVEQGWSDDGREYWVVYLPGGDAPAFDLARDEDGRYLVADRGAVLARLSEEGLFRWLEGQY